MNLDTWHEIATTLARNKLRTFLTACGVFWGIFMLIAMIGLGEGLYRGTRDKLGGLIARSVFVWSHRTSMPHKGLPPGRFIRFSDDDTVALSRIPGVEDVAPRLQLGGWRDGANVSYATTTANFTVMGDVPAYRRVEHLDIVRGRFLNDRDQSEARKVAVIGIGARHVLFGDADPVGHYVKIRRAYFQIVGEASTDEPGDSGEHVRSTLFVPFSTFQRVFNARGRVGWYSLTAAHSAPAEEVERAVRRVLSRRHGVHPDDMQAVGSFNAAERFERVEGLFRGIRVFVWLVGTLTLLAGVLGVSNILLITVKERTREIGVRKAIGATPWAITAMVLKEAVLLTSLAGYAGLVAGVGALELLADTVARLPDAPLNRPEVDLRAALLATLVLILSGALAGVVPARHAARISPVRALRGE